MQTTRSARTLAIVATVLVLALLTAGCGRRTSGADGGSLATPVVTTPVVVAPATTVPPTIDPATTSTPATTPVPTPDLSAIDSLIKDIDNDLQADASAGINEGTAP